MTENRALAALQASGIAHTVTRHGPVRSLEEAAVVRGMRPRDILKTLVVRRGDDDYICALVPGDRQISWPKLRALLNVSRLSMPDATTARDVTGYERGTITPYGALHPWPVIADATILTVAPTSVDGSNGTGAKPVAGGLDAAHPAGTRARIVSIGAGEHGVAATVRADELVSSLNAEVADITDPLRLT